MRQARHHTAEQLAAHNLHVGTQSAYQDTKEAPEGTLPKGKPSSHTRDRGHQATTMLPNQNSTRLYLLSLVRDDAVIDLADVFVDECDVLVDEASVGQDVVGPEQR